MAWQAVHEPLEVPPQYLAPFAAIGDPSRRVYAGMLAALDEGLANESIDSYSSAIRLDPRNAEGYFRRSTLHLALGDVSSAGDDARLRGVEPAHERRDGRRVVERD